ncbi:MAG: MarR family winged helix-turn-helix transcriptional regulator [Lachnospiraceae bacterium]
MSDRVELKHLEMENQKYQFRYLRNQLNEKKLYRGDPRLLMYVYFHDGRKQAEIAKGLCVKPASLTVMLQRMEQAGLVNRKSDEQDQRVQRVYITRAGPGDQQENRGTLSESGERFLKGCPRRSLRSTREFWKR